MRTHTPSNWSRRTLDDNKHCDPHLWSAGHTDRHASSTNLLLMLPVASASLISCFSTASRHRRGDKKKFPLGVYLSLGRDRLGSFAFPGHALFSYPPPSHQPSVVACIFSFSYTEGFFSSSLQSLAECPILVSRSSTRAYFFLRFLGSWLPSLPVFSQHRNACSSRGYPLFGIDRDGDGLVGCFYIIISRSFPLLFLFLMVFSLFPFLLVYRTRWVAHPRS